MTVTRDNVAYAIKASLAVAEAIRELGEVPSGVLYAQLCGVLTIEQYNAIIQALKNANLVSESSHLLKWTGPVFETPYFG